MKSGFEASAKVKDLIINGVWNWPEEWNWKWPLLDSVDVPELHIGVKGQAIWRTSTGIDLNFTISEAWLDWRLSSGQVPWCKHVWFTQCVPKHAFIMWLTIKDKLMTKDKIKKWNPNVDEVCVLCKKDKETRNHSLVLNFLLVFGTLLR